MTEKSQSRYQLRVGELRTSLLRRGVRLRPAKAAGLWQQARQPRLLADIGKLRVTGLGLLRCAVVPIDSILLANARLRVLPLPAPDSQARSLHEQLPPPLNGLRIGYLRLVRLQAAYGSSRVPQASVRQASCTAQDILLTAAGAADPQWLGYTAAFGARVAGAAGLVVEHRILLGAGRFSSGRQQLVLDSLRSRSVQDVRKPGNTARVWLRVPRVRVTGINSAELRSRQLRLDSLVLTRPWMVAAPPVPPPPLHEVLAPAFGHIELNHLLVRGGTLRLTGIKPQPQIQDIRLRAENVLLTAAGARAPARIWYARAWELCPRLGATHGSGAKRRFGPGVLARPAQHRVQYPNRPDAC